MIDDNRRRLMPLNPGTRLGRYEVVAPLGAGGMGEVYRAHDTQLRRDVAVKVVHEASGGDPDRLRRFEQEALATAALNHPNILAIFDVGTHDGRPFVVSELLEGRTLREVLGAGGHVEAHQIRLPDEFVAHAASRGFEAAASRGTATERDDRFWRDWASRNAPFRYEPSCHACHRTPGPVRGNR